MRVRYLLVEIRLFLLPRLQNITAVIIKKIPMMMVLYQKRAIFPEYNYNAN